MQPILQERAFYSQHVHESKHVLADPKFAIKLSGLDTKQSVVEPLEGIYRLGP